jgi:hypothetical protein
MDGVDAALRLAEFAEQQVEAPRLTFRSIPLWKELSGASLEL